MQLNDVDSHAGTSSRRRAAAAGTQVSVAATAAARAVSIGTVSFAVESLWPVNEESVMMLAAAIYGLLLRVLPACVRIWFTGIRDRATASAIENFTSSNCSTHLLADEFSQVRCGFRNICHQLIESMYCLRQFYHVRQCTV